MQKPIFKSGTNQFKTELDPGLRIQYRELSAQERKSIDRGNPRQWKFSSMRPSAGIMHWRRIYTDIGCFQRKSKRPGSYCAELSRFNISTHYPDIVLCRDFAFPLDKSCVRPVENHGYSAS